MIRFSQQFSRWRSLTRWERGVLWQQVRLLPRVWLLLRWRGLKTACVLLQEFSNSASMFRIPVGMSALDYAQRCAELTAMAARHGFYEAKCLHQSLALQNLLGKSGLHTKLRIGVLPGSMPLQAHAWVELDGVVLGTGSPPGYHVLAGFDAETLQSV